MENVTFLMDLYDRARYPHGDEITKAEVVKSLKIAEDIVKKME